MCGRAHGCWMTIHFLQAPADPGRFLITQGEAEKAWRQHSFMIYPPEFLWTTFVLTPITIWLPSCMPTQGPAQGWGPVKKVQCPSFFRVHWIRSSGKPEGASCRVQRAGDSKLRPKADTPGPHSVPRDPEPMSFPAGLGHSCGPPQER